MILGRKRILELIEAGEISIEPFKPENLGPVALDVTLDSKFRVFDRLTDPLEIHDESFDPAKYGDVVDTEGAPITIGPHTLVLGITRERITLSNRVMGWISGRSRFARIGLLVHVSSNIIKPGVSNRQVLEIYNLSPVPVKLYPGVKIAQVVFEEVDGAEGAEDSRYFFQDSP